MAHKRGNFSTNVGNDNSSYPIIKPLVYVSSPIALENTSSFDYFISIINILVTEVETMLNRDIIIKIPSGYGNIVEEQKKIILNILENYSQFSGIIISAYNANEIKSLFEEKLELIKEVMKQIPIITIDKVLPKINNFQIPYVTGDWFDGGKVAARKALEFITNKENRKNKIIIIKGDKEGSTDRINGFKKIFKQSQNKDVKVVTLRKEINYSREAAFQYINGMYRNRELDFDVIFCCNDEMALGVREFFLTKNINSNNVKIIGFDGTVEFKWIRQKVDRYLFYSVDVNIDNQVKTLVKFIKEYPKKKKLNYKAPIRNG